MSDTCPHPVTAPPAPAPQAAASPSPAPPAHVQPGHAPPLQLNVTSDPANLASVRRACEAFCISNGLDATASGEVGLSVNEAMANVIRHAYAGAADRPLRVTAEADADGRAIRVRVRDWGPGVDPSTLPPRECVPDRPGGLGLMCIRALMDEVTYERQPDGMLLTMVKRKARGKR